MKAQKNSTPDDLKGLFQRGDTWHFRWSVDGRQRRVTLNTRDKDVAMERALKRVTQPELRDAGLWAVEVRDYIADRRARGKLSATAAVTRKAILTRFAEDMSIAAPKYVTRTIVQRWYESLQGREVAEVSCHSYVRWLRTFLQYLAARGRVVQDISGVELNRLRKTKRKPFCSAEQVRAIIAAASDDEMRFVLYCGFHAGLRRGEIAEARPEWFDLTNGLLHLQRSATWEPKDRDDRTIPLTAEFAAFLRAYGPPGPFCLPGTPLDRERKWRYRYDFRKTFTTLMKKVKMPWVTPHTMRRTFASLLVSDGVSPYKVSTWLGNGIEVVQKHYGHLTPKDADIERGR
jgi:integrase